MLKGLVVKLQVRVYLESVLISSCSSSNRYGCVFSNQCNVTMDKITITDTDYAITAYQSSTLNIFNSLALNDTVEFVKAQSSDMTFWNMNIRGADIEIDQSVAEFRHTIYMTPDTNCPIEDKSGSNIILKSVYNPPATDMSQSEGRIVCKGSGTVIYGNMSGNTFTSSKCSQSSDILHKK